METLAIVRKTPSSSRLRVPEPKALWTADLKKKKRTVIEAKTLWALFRSRFGFEIPTNVNSLSFGSEPIANQKFGKSLEENGGRGILVYGLSLAQSNLSGINVCRWSTPECRRACVGKNGNNGYPAVMQAKIAKTRFLFEHPQAAGILLADFWEKAQSKTIESEVGGRLNTYSDINWIATAPWIFEHFVDINFYDYTKDWGRVSPYGNYHLTYSASEKTTDEEIIRFVEAGNNVAVVFSSWSTLPDTHLGLPVVDGDKDDVRWRDPAGVIVGLRRKGQLKAESLMVRQI